MSDRRTTSPDPGFVPFRAATALGRDRAATPDEGAPRKAPPLPAPPPGAPEREGAPPAPATPARRAPPRPSAPPPGAGPEAVWMALVAWCREAGVAEGGLAARPGGDVVAAAGELGPGAPGEMALAVDAALGAAGAEARAVAVELSGRWVTGFRVAVPGGDVLVCLRGKTAVRADLRDALAAWAGGALRGA